MRKLMVVLSVITVMLFLVSCAPAQKPIVCDAPYILVGTECCLDENNNAICDSDETIAAPEVPAPAPVVEEKSPAEEMQEMMEIEEGMEEMPLVEEEVEEIPAGETEIQKFMRTATKTFGEPFRRGATNEDQPPKFLTDIAAKDRYGFELGNRIAKWWVGFDDISSIELYGTVALKDNKQVILPVKPTGNLLFKSSEPCVGNPNCGDIPFAYQWDKGEITFLYCPLSWEICKSAKVRFVDRYS